jgi:hypothetical protein
MRVSKQIDNDGNLNKFEQIEIIASEIMKFI